MTKYVALQHILHNGRLHNPGETIDCPDPKLAAIWIANKAVKAVGPVEVEAPVAPVTPKTDEEPEPAPEAESNAGQNSEPEPAVEVEPEPEPEPAPEAEPPKLGRRAGASK